VAFSIGLLVIVRTLVFFMVTGVIFCGMPDCDAIRKEMRVYSTLSPAGLTSYKNNFFTCNIYSTHGLIISDYFNTEHNALLTLVPLAIKNKTIHPVLIKYFIKNQRWDLLLLVLNEIKALNKLEQISVLNLLYYEDLPGYFDAEFKEIFNLFTEAEKISSSQQLFPTNMSKLRRLFRMKNPFIIQYWPLFDRMAVLVHLKEFYPDLFDKSRPLWNSIIESKADQKNSNLVLIKALILNDSYNASMASVDPAFKAFYFIKRNEFEKATDVFKVSHRQVFLQILRYFEFYTPLQQSYLLSVSLPFSLANIQTLFDSYFFQLGHPVFQQWVWQLAIDNDFNLDVYVKHPYHFVRVLPHNFRPKLVRLSPLNAAVQQSFNGIGWDFYRRDISGIGVDSVRWVDLSKTKKDQLIGAILNAYKTPISHKQFLELIPHLSVQSQLSFIQEFPYLANIPRRFWKRWTNLTQPKLADLNDQ
jgi:hypothetical protein